MSCRTRSGGAASRASRGPIRTSAGGGPQRLAARTAIAPAPGLRGPRGRAAQPLVPDFLRCQMRTRGGGTTEQYPAPEQNTRNCI
eukprot:scaffold38124_cov74-Phaeocystis_antarctica.AAC.3